MRQFFKFLTASCLGTLLALALIVFIFVIGGLISSIGGNDLANKSILKIDVGHIVPEKSNNVASQGQFQFEEFEQIGLHRIKDLIEHAKTDKAIKGVVIEGNQSAFGPAALFSIEESLRDFKTSEKFVYAYGEFFTQQGYFISSVSDSIFLNPMGMIDVRGFSMMIPFFKNFMDKMGIEMQIFYAGDFKSATEPFRRTEMSEYNREQSKVYLNSLKKHFNQRLADNRSKSVAEVNQCINEFCMKDAKTALASGFIDGIITRSKFEDILRDKLGLKKTKAKINYVDIYEYNNKANIENKKSKDNQIAVVIAEGEIQFGANGKGVISEDKYIEIFDKIIKNDKIKSVVLRVNSPGGSALTSDIIWDKIEEVKAAGKPVIASFGDYAASGGYYISCGADTIVAEANSLTGSIGVFSMMPKVKRLMEDKIGINFDTVKTAPLAVALSPFHDLTPQEIEIMEKNTDDIYQRFLEVVAEGRGQSTEEIHKVAQGRIWSGEQALSLGLVDVLGDLDDAIDLAANKLDSEDYSLRYYPSIKQNPYQQIINEVMKGDASLQSPKLSMNEQLLLDQYSKMRQILSQEGPMMRMPLIIQ